MSCYAVLATVPLLNGWGIVVLRGKALVLKVCCCGHSVYVKTPFIGAWQIGKKHERINVTLRATGLPHDHHFAAYCNHRLGLVLQCLKEVCTVLQGTTGPGRYREKRPALTLHADFRQVRYFRPVPTLLQHALENTLRGLPELSL